MSFSADPMIAGLIARLQTQPSHTGSLIVTIFGDAVLPRGGEIALSSLLSLCADLDIAPGVVRTAMSRLAADGWFISSRAGRASFYRVAPARRGEMIRASRHIFGPARHPDVNQLNLVFAEGNDWLRARLGRLGFVAWQGVMIAPQRPLPPSLTQMAPVLVAAGDAASLRTLAAKAWRLEDLAARYQGFITTYDGLAQHAPMLPPREALIARLLLVHDFRRIALRDPRLPGALLVEDWPGQVARQLCAAIYPALRDAAEARLDEIGATTAGALPPAEPDLCARFTG
ncbi:MAG TPA: PaaX family transcriptional regulator C-terminal domain-containing protein [Acidiphilium sp.]|nr:PaaX family transcriptional regulator C-terminal domain-containing protein [Acidiphilium sp.]HQU23699.1 PaaX family transcriptional regulator C-terminal domain-containing protein [Acidiphilium sp.]